MAAEMLGCKLGLAAYLGCYQKAIKTVEEKLDKETWVKYHAEAKKWTAHRLPPWQQLWYVHADSSI